MKYKTNPKAISEIDDKYEGTTKNATPRYKGTETTKAKLWVMKNERRNLNMSNWSSKRNNEREAIFEEIEGPNFLKLIKGIS